MELYTLYTYKNTNELRQIQDKYDVHSFVFQETLELLKIDSEVCVDITALVYLLRSNPENLHSAYMNLREMDENTKVIVHKDISEEALDRFSNLFFQSETLITENEQEYETNSEVKPIFLRNPVYTYDNIDTLNIISEYSKEKDIPLVTFSQANDLRKEMDKLNKAKELVLMDLTSISYVIEHNKNLIYLVETLLNIYHNIRIIVQTKQADVLIEYFPLYFKGQEKIIKLLEGIKIIKDGINLDEKIKTVVALTDAELNLFIDEFEHNLIGHNNFKDKFKYAVKNFCLLNKVKEQKVLSIFLFGSSGIGKTEVARIISEKLYGADITNPYLAKINFQNYSSQDALNSLIGSPAGYIGCEHGELSEKIKKSKVGVLLCDEFEKTTRPVFSYFLELLEEGKFTDSLAREYDLDGYIIIFTSNIRNESEYKKTIPPELQTRFDLVCEFQPLKYDDKTRFISLLIEKSKNKFSDQFAKITFTEKDERYLYDFDYGNIEPLREIKKKFNNRLMDLFQIKGI